MSKTYIFCDDPTLWGGIQEFVRKLVSYLDKDQTSVMSYYADISAKKSFSGFLYKLNDRKLKNGLYKLLGSRSGDYLSHSSFRKNFALFRDIPFIRKRVERALGDGGNTIIINAFSQAHLFCTKRVLANNRIVCVLHSAPNVVRHRRYDFGGFFHRRKCQLFKNYVDDVVFLAPGLDKSFSEFLDFSGKRLHFIRHAVYAPLDLTEIYDGGVAFIGRLVSLKHPERVFDLAKLLPKVKFNIYGDGPLFDKLKQLNDTMPNVLLHGYVSTHDEIFSNNSLVLIISDYEGYPINGIESLVYGKPLIVLNSFPTASDLVIDNYNGILLDKYNSASVADAICRVYADYHRFHLGAVESSKRYDSTSIGNQWRNLLQSSFKQENK